MNETRGNHYILPCYQEFIQALFLKMIYNFRSYTLVIYHLQQRVTEVVPAATLVRPPVPPAWHQPIFKCLESDAFEAPGTIKQSNPPVDFAPSDP